MAASRNTATLADDQFATPAYGVGFNAAVRRSETAYSWELGVDARDFDGSSHDALFNQGNPTGTRVGGGGEWIAGAYAEGSRTLGPLLLTGGVRLDGWETYDSSLVQTGSSPLVQHPADRSGAVPTGRVGLRRDFADGLYLRAAAYAGFRMVTLNELHRSFRVGNDVTEANAGLSPEKLYGVEGGRRRPVKLGRFSWDADVFFNQLADAVTNVTIGKGPGSFPLAGFVPAGGTLFERENAGTVNAWGVEGDADYGARRGLRPARRASPTPMPGSTAATAAPQLTGLRPAETPAVGRDRRRQLARRGAADADRRAALRELALRRRPEHPQDRGGAGLGLRAEWRFTNDLAGFVAADNVTNANLQTGRSAAGVVTYDAPRMVRAGLTWRR